LIHFKNTQVSNALAKTLLVGRVLTGEEYGSVGPQFLVFESDDVRRTRSRLEISIRSRIEFREGENSILLDLRKADSREQTEKLHGTKVQDAKLEGEGLVISFLSGDSLIVSGNVTDPDSEGWSLYGDVFVGIGQDVVEGFPYASLPDSMSTILRCSDEEG